MVKFWLPSPNLNGPTLHRHIFNQIPTNERKTNWKMLRIVLGLQSSFCLGCKIAEPLFIYVFIYVFIYLFIYLFIYSSCVSATQVLH